MGPAAEGFRCSTSRWKKGHGVPGPPDARKGPWPCLGFQVRAWSTPSVPDPGHAPRPRGPVQGVEAVDIGRRLPDVGRSGRVDRLGPALEHPRERVFLACKTTQRLAKEADAELRRSLERLKARHFDLYQFHGVSSLAEAEQILSPGGALEAFIAARERGLIRHIGFSAHSEEAAMLASMPGESRMRS